MAEKTAADENFPVGSPLIKAALRPHVHAFYRFARAADDIADDRLRSPAEKLARLDRMARVLDGDKPGEADPIAAAMRASLAATGVTAAHCHDLLVAFRRDATQRRWADWDALMDYCRWSAAPVGRQLLDLHGESAECRPASDALCAALQVLNHLQDQGEDYRALDRVYVPLDLLAAHGTRAEDLAYRRSTPGLAAVRHAVLDRTDALLATAASLPPMIRDRRLRWEAAVILAMGEALARRLRGDDPLAGRVALGKVASLVAAVSGLARLTRSAAVPARRS
ncbi:MAG: squalene synthase HpnC [Alphaproteobacteria bacterium]|nr:squalene synthase HpnC [Alphaproteobacteria bacterium]